jgi:hypothetical protein
MAGFSPELISNLTGSKTLKFCLHSRPINPITGALGKPYPGLHAGAFVNFSINFLEANNGIPVTRISDDWHPRTHNHNVFTQLTGQGMHPVEAVCHTWSGKIYSQAGFRISNEADIEKHPGHLQVLFHRI